MCALLGLGLCPSFCRDSLCCVERAAESIQEAGCGMGTGVAEEADRETGLSSVNGSHTTVCSGAERSRGP